MRVNLGYTCLHVVSRDCQVYRMTPVKQYRIEKERGLQGGCEHLFGVVVMQIAYPPEEHFF